MNGDISKSPARLDTDPTLNGPVVLAGRYMVVHELGRGGMGAVYLAEDQHLDGRKVAIKMPSALLAMNPRAVREMKREAVLAMTLSHPHIVTLRAFEQTNDGKVFLVMDYVEGKTLEQLLVERHLLDEVTVQRLFRLVATALDYAHKKCKVLHRDIKPSNILLDRDNRPYLTDFGVARELKDTYTTATGGMHDTSGTLPYMSPQQINGDPPDASQDIYSLAATMYECLTGHPPFYRGDIRDQIKHKLPDPLPSDSMMARQVMRGLSKESKDRPRRCIDLVPDPGKPMLVEPVAGPVPPPPTTGTPVRRPRGRLVVLSCFLALQTIVAGLALWYVASAPSGNSRTLWERIQISIRQWWSRTDEELLALAKNHLDNGRLDAALKVLAELAEQNQSHPDLLKMHAEIKKRLLEDAEASLRTHAYDDTIVFLEKAFKIDYDRAVYGKLEDARSAKVEWDRKVKIESLWKSATAHQTSGRFDEAMTDLKKLLELEPTHALALKMREDIRDARLESARRRKSEKQFDLAVELFNTVLEIRDDPAIEAERDAAENDGNKHREIASLMVSATKHRADRNWDAAIRDIDNILAKDPRHDGALNLRKAIRGDLIVAAEIAGNAMRYPEVIVFYRKAIDIADDPGIQGKLKDVQAKLKQQEENEKQIQKLLSSAKEHKDGGRFEEALKDLDAILKLNPENTNAKQEKESIRHDLISQAKAHHDAKEYPQSISCFTLAQTIKSDPNIAQELQAVQEEWDKSRPPRVDPGFKMLKHPGGRSVVTMAISDCGTRLAAADESGRIAIWNMADGTQLVDMVLGRSDSGQMTIGGARPMSIRLRAMLFDRDSTSLILAPENGGLFQGIPEGKDQGTIGSLLESRSKIVYMTTIRPQSARVGRYADRLLVIDQDAQLHVFKVGRLSREWIETAKLLSDKDRNHQMVTVAVVSADGGTAMLGMSDGRLWRVDLAEAPFGTRQLRDAGLQISAIGIAPAGHMAAASGTFMEIIQDSAGGIRRERGFAGVQVGTLAFLDDNKLITASVMSTGGMIHEMALWKWDSATGTLGKPASLDHLGEPMVITLGGCYALAATGGEIRPTALPE